VLNAAQQPDAGPREFEALRRFIGDNQGLARSFCDIGITAEACIIEKATSGPTSEAAC
jgi:hypothetical protein